MLGTMSTLAEQLGAALFAVRTAVGISQGELGRRIDTKQSMISEYESGEKMLPLRLMPLMDEALGVARGTILARAGLVDHDVTARDAIAADSSLHPEDRRLLLGFYDRSRKVRHVVEAKGDGVTDHP